MAAASEGVYLGGELDLFALATNWKRYVKSEIGQYLGGDVLEVGAGIAGTTVALHMMVARAAGYASSRMRTKRDGSKQWPPNGGETRRHPSWSGRCAPSRNNRFSTVLYMD